MFIQSTTLKVSLSHTFAKSYSHATCSLIGQNALQIMLEQPVISTLLLDFKIFDDAESSGKMISCYRPDFYLPGHNYNSRGRGGFSRGGNRGNRSSYSSRGRGNSHGVNTSFRGGFRRGRGSGRGRSGYRGQNPYIGKYTIICA